MKKIIYLLVFCLVFSTLFASEDQHDHAREIHQADHDDHEGHDEHEEQDDHDEHHHEGSKAVGPGKAIEENSPTEGIRLNPETVKKLGIEVNRFLALKGSELQKALVLIKDETFLYRENKGHFELVPYPKGPFKPLDKIVVSGHNLVRISEVYANDESEYGHSH